MRIMLSWVNDTCESKKKSSPSNRNRTHDLVVTSPESIQMTYSRVYSRVQPCRISAIWKKMPHEIYVAASSGAPEKVDPRISAIFFSNNICGMWFQ